MTKIRPFFSFIILFWWATTPVFASKIEVHGHRGAKAIYFENSKSSIEYALEQKVDYVEFDLHLTADNILILTHDPYLDTEKCRYKNGRLSPENPEKDWLISEMTMQEIKQITCGFSQVDNYPQHTGNHDIITFQEALEVIYSGNLASYQPSINVEIKYPKPGDFKKMLLYPAPQTLVTTLLSEISEFNLNAENQIPSEKVVVQSFHPQILSQLKKALRMDRDNPLNQGLRTSFLFSGGHNWRRQVNVDWEMVFAAIKDNEIDILSPSLKMIKLTRLWSLKKFKEIFLDEMGEPILPIIPYTPDTEDDWRFAIEELKATGIITNRPRALIDYLNSK